MADTESQSGLLSLDPDEKLEFKRPFQSTSKQTLKVTNTSNDHIAFKVKTTAPKQYCVRPNAGRIAPGQFMSVEILLQPMKDDPPADFKCKDKFLVQGVKIPKKILEEEQTDDLAARLQEVWATAESQKKDPQFAGSIMAEKKLRVVFTGESAARSPPPLPAGDAGDSAPSPFSGGNAATQQLPTGPVLSSLPREDLERQLTEAQQQVRKLQANYESLKQSSSSASAKGKKGSQSITFAKKERDMSLDIKMVALVALIAFILGYWLSK
ncbi:phosphatidylinositol-binding protein scs2 [Gonapodya sp. JEL0774]|nr:phosphatidylinositol-binding protein scs2 [Gonapodya sp. JEL0774]